MDLGMGNSVPKENLGCWIPVTPAKPTPMRPQPIISADKQVNQLGRANWLQFQSGLPITRGMGLAPHFDSMGSVDLNKGLEDWESALEWRNQSYSYTDTAAEWNNVPFADLVAIANAASASATACHNTNVRSNSLSPSSYFQIDGGGGQASSSTSLLLANQHPNRQLKNSRSLLLGSQDLLPGSNPRFSGNCPPQIPQYGFPVPYSPTYDLNMLPRITTDESSNGTITLQLAPVTPNQAANKADKNQLSEILNLGGDGRPIQKNEDTVGLVVNEANELQCNEEPLQFVDTSSAAAILTPVNENLNKGDHGIDLNKTPQLKARRKKHRPKVVRESKPKHTPKPETPKAKEKPTGKRKYVRKKGPKATPLSDAAMGKTSDPTLGHARKSCKRALNFDLEDHHATEENIGTTASHLEGHPHGSLDNASCSWVSNFNLESQAHDLCNTSVDGSGTTKSTVHLEQGMQLTVENTQAGIAYDLTRSMNQILTDYISMPERQSPTNLIATMKDPPSDNLDALVRNGNGTGTHGACQNGCTQIHQLVHVDRTGSVFPAEDSLNDNHESANPIMLHRGPQAVPKSQKDLNCHKNVHLSEAKQARGSKREYPQTIGQPHQTLNLIGAHYNSLQAYQEVFRVSDHHCKSRVLGLNFPEIYKKKRTERGQTATMSSMSSSSTAVEDGLRRIKACSRSVINFSNFAPQSTTWGVSSTQFDNSIAPKKQTSMVTTSIPDPYAQSWAVECNTPSQKKSAGLVSFTGTESQATLDKQQFSECNLTFGLTGTMTKKRSKGLTRVRDLASLKAIVKFNQLPHTPSKQTPAYGDGRGNEISHGTQACMEALLADNLAKMTTKKRTKKGPPVNSVFPASTNELCVQEHQNFLYNYCQSSAKSKSSSLGQKAIKSSTRTSHVLPINSIRGHKSSGTNSFRSFEPGPMEVIRKHVPSINEIVERLKCLDINADGNKTAGQDQKALVPYSRHGTMVPYEGQFDPTKKRRPRPKVDLDPETNRVWKLLMGKQGDEGVEETGKDKEKWWEDERRVFRGRADSFVARMRLVQGDRRFSQWKGSVVDSVIGVFLTQNVSDHLSSSAFMSLAARFPLKSTRNHRAHDGETIISVEEPEVYIVDADDTMRWHEKMSSQLSCDQNSPTFHGIDHIDEREIANSQESFGSNMGDLISAENLKGKQLLFCESGLEMWDGSQEKSTHTLTKGTENASLVEAGSRRVEDVSSQNSVVSPQNSVESPNIRTAERIGSCSDSNSEVDDLTIGCRINSMDGSSFMELLQTAGNTIFQESYSHGNGNLSLNERPSTGHKQVEDMEFNKHRSCLNKLDLLKDSFAATYLSDPHPPHIQVPVIPSSNYRLHMTPDSGLLEVECLEIFREESRSSLPSNASEVTETKDVGCMSKQIGLTAESVCETPVQPKVLPIAREAAADHPYVALRRHQAHPVSNSQNDAHIEKNLNPCNNHHDQITKIFQPENTLGAEPTQHASNLPKFSGETLDIVESTSLLGKQNALESTRDESNEKQIYSTGMKFNGTNTDDTMRAKRRSVNVEKNNEFDWDSLRKQAPANGKSKERSSDTMDSIDWEAVRCADVEEISNAIKERGMNNMLAERIKDFLNRLVRDHGSIDLEWLRDVPPDKTKEYLLSVRGLGLKSVECVRLLTLHHLAFPVDTNVGRIAVRLGWVPLQPLPESLQLHLLELYPMLESIQKYLWPRLCTLDQRSLYELHYQMITFGKVFCTKSKPNCNACPMRGECRHFASAFASARLALPGPEEKSIVSSTAPYQDPTMVINPIPLPLPEANTYSEAISGISNYEPIIEVPATPEPECTEVTEADIEDAFYEEDPDEIPTIKLNIEEFTQNLQNYMQENNMELQEVNMSRALVALTPEATSIPTPKLKNVSRLRTEHQVYELPDSHPLLKGLDRREPDDPCSYLLAIWIPGETANSIQPPEKRCGSQESGQLCNDETCFSCNSVREANSQTVRGTLLIPCRTAMRGSFPLNGTYFQVNEVFADHDSSLNPIDVPRAWIWNLRRRTVYFGTSIPTIFKGLLTEDIQKCFWKGFVCVRGFDQKTRAPRPLMARLHFPASKLTQLKMRRK